jgi:hypothetical protein
MAKVKYGVVAFLVAFVLCLSPAYSMPSGTASSLDGGWLDIDVTLKYRQAALGNIFASLGKIAGVEFRVSADLNYPVSFDIRRSTVRRLLELLEESQSLAYEQVGDTIIVSKAER